MRSSSLLFVAAPAFSLAVAFVAYAPDAAAQTQFYCTSTVNPPPTRPARREPGSPPVTAPVPPPHDSRCAVLRNQCEDARRAFRTAGTQSSRCAPRREAFCYSISLPGLSLLTVECAITLGQCRALRDAALTRAHYAADDPRVEACLILDPGLAGRVATSPTHRVRSPDGEARFCHDERTASPPCASTHRACAEALRYDRATFSWDDAAVRCTRRAEMHCYTLRNEEGERCFRTADDCTNGLQAARGTENPPTPVRTCHRVSDAQ